MATKGSDRPRNRPSGAKTGANVPLTKYYRSGDQPTTGRSPFRLSVKKSTRRRRLAKFTDVAVIVAVMFCLVYSLIVKPSPRILVSDTSYRSVSAYQDAAANELRALKNRNKATLDEASIEANLIKKYPEITTVSVELPLLGQTPTVRLDISEPTFFLTSNGQTYIVDSQGRAAGLAIDLPQVKNLPTVADQSGFSTKSGKQVLSMGQVNFIKVLIAQTTRSKVPVQSLTLPALPAELDLRTPDRPYFVKFFLGGDALQQTGQYLAARHNFDQSGSQPGQYLDVRVTGKIFYK